MLIFIANIQDVSISFPIFKGYVFKNSVIHIPIVIYYHKELTKQSAYKCLSFISSKTDVIIKQRFVKSHQAAFPLSKLSSDEENPFIMLPCRSQKEMKMNLGASHCANSHTWEFYSGKNYNNSQETTESRSLQLECKSLTVSLVLCAT